MFHVFRRAIASAFCCALFLAFTSNGYALELGGPRLVSQYGGECIWSTFDATGAAVVDYPDHGRQYNPVTVAQVAIGCYHLYKQTDDPKARKIYLDQIEWLKTNAVSSDDDHAYFEYGFPWSYGLKPGRRSGLAQGQAISALIRYHYDTGDASILPLIRKLKNLMMLPVTKGGTLATTPEGGLWIEEFPSTPPSYVLNGFNSAIFGLYEFTRLFPGDSQAATELADAISSLKASLQQYDTGNSSILDRTPGRPEINDSYGAAHVAQLGTLFAITGDPFFQRVRLRWQAFLEDVNFRSNGNMSADPHGNHVLQPKSLPSFSPNLLKDNYTVARATSAVPGYGIDRLFDGREDTYYAPAQTGPTTIELEAVRPVVANALTITLYNIALYPKKVRIFVRSGYFFWHEVTYTKASNRRYVSFFFDEPQTIRAIRLVAVETAGQDRLVIGGLSLSLQTKATVTPGYGSFHTPPFEITAKKFKVHVTAPRQSHGQIVAIYRHADTLDELAAAPWQWDFLGPFGSDVREAAGRFYQFNVLATQEAGTAGWTSFTVSTPD